MRRFRFRIGILVILVLVLGVGFAALRESNENWDNSRFTLTLVALVVSIFFAVHRTESRRAFWLGFALFGWIYWRLSLVPSIESRLLTTKALAFLDSQVPGRSQGLFTVRLTGIGSGAPSNQVQNLALTIDGNQLTSSNQGVVGLRDATTGQVLGRWIGTTENFIRIGHSLFTLIAAFLGGQVSRHLYAKNRESTPRRVLPKTAITNSL